MLPPVVPYLLDIKDLFLTPLYILLLYFFIRRWKNRHYKELPFGKFIIPAVSVRMIGCVFLVLLYNYYYGYGDTYGYYTGAKEIWDAFFINPKFSIQILGKSPDNYSPFLQSITPYMSYTGFSHSTYLMSKIPGIISFFSFGSYFPIALFFCLFSFWGTWLIYLVLVDLYPHLYKVLAISTLFVPSVVIWTNGILKEPLCMLGLGICFYSFYHLLKGSGRKKYLLYFVSGAVILLMIKNYIFFAFAGSALLWYYKSFFSSKRSGPSKFFARFILAIVFVSAGIYLIVNSGEIIDGVLADTFKKTEFLQNAMTKLNEDSGGSGYVIPTATDFSFFGIVQSFFSSLNVALFRPYIWECTSVFMLMNFFESFVTFLLVLLVFFKVGIIQSVKRINHSPVLLFCFVFSIVMATMSGFISFNFGTLIRYKTPFLPFFFSLLLILLYDKTPMKLMPDNKSTTATT